MTCSVRLLVTLIKLPVRAQLSLLDHQQTLHLWKGRPGLTPNMHGPHVCRYRSLKVPETSVRPHLPIHDHRHHRRLGALVWWAGGQGQPLETLLATPCGS